MLWTIQKKMSNELTKAAQKHGIHVDDQSCTYISGIITCMDGLSISVSPDGKVSLWSDKYTIENKHKIFKLLDSWIGYLRGFMFEVEDGKLKSIINKK